MGSHKYQPRHLQIEGEIEIRLTQDEVVTDLRECLGGELELYRNAI
jgi:hypothetical protein